MIEVKLLGAKPQDYALLSDESGKWYATCKPEHAEAVKAAIEAQMAANAKDSHQTDAAQGRD